MKNTIITSVSAIVFLVIGLFIGKSNKQIEIQTVVKTNIVEKPVEKIVEKIVEKPVKEYVDKYITNVVEKVIQADIPSDYNKSYFVNKLLDGEWLYKTNGFSTPYFESVHVSANVSEALEDIITADDIKEKVEFELRKAGIKVSDKSRATLHASLDGFDLDNKLQYVFKYSLDLRTRVFLYDFENKIVNKHIVPIWTESDFRIAGKSVINKSYIKTKFTDASEKIINKLLEAKQKHENINEKK
jgi:hypothetical protein